jgi:hypothetical protein
VTASLVIVRDAIYDAVKIARDAGELAYNGFQLSRSHAPVVDVIDFPPEGQLWVVGLAWRTGNSESRGAIRKRDLPVQVAYQEPVDKAAAGYFALMDARIELIEQLDLLVAKLKIAGYMFVEIEPLKESGAGPNQLPFTFGGLRKANTFESYFTSWWREII